MVYPYVRAAKQRIERGLGFTPGMKVGYVVTDAKSSPMKVTAWLTEELGDDPPEYDSEYYAKRLATALGRITEAFEAGAKATYFRALGNNPSLISRNIESQDSFPTTSGGRAW